MAARNKKSNSGTYIFIILLLLAICGGFVAYKIWGPNTGSMKKGEYLYIPTGASYDYVLNELEEGGYVADIASFDILAERANYPNHVKAGRYKIPAGMSNIDMIRKLRSGRQSPLDLVINKLRTKEDFIRLVASKLEPDSASLGKIISDSNYLKKYGFNNETALAVVIPDTYEFFWNTSADGVYSRLADYYNRFWNEERKQKAFSKNLTPTQVMILASIVEEETNKVKERPVVASVYLNRLEHNMKLQADPTIKFALQNFALRRILNTHLQSESPYNTYRFQGLPPGPIATPSKSSIQAVLNAPDTDYLYFCAKEDFSGYHNFASSYSEHMKNARAYQKALNERGIKI